MSKPISFGLSSKNKPTSNTAKLPTSKHGVPKTISFSTSSANPRKSFNTALSKPKSAALRDDSDDEDEGPPVHEELTGFSSTGAILSQPTQQKTERVIESAGNGDWRKRGKNLLPHEVQAANNGEVVTVEKDEVSKAYGLQFAQKDAGASKEHSNGDTEMQDSGSSTSKPVKEMTEDERALAALLDDGTGKPKSTATIDVQANDDWQRNETDDLRASVAMLPESCTLDEYADMPVEEFGMAMLRGMGKKRRANGEVIDLNKDRKVDEDKKRKERKQEGFLGIGAKPAKGLEGVELGAWGKADMRKNNRGEGFFTPVMLEDKTTGDRITEEEFERRKKAARNGVDKKGEDDWRDRRDRNLERSGRDGDGHGRELVVASSKKRDRDEEKSSRSRRDRNGDRDRDRDDRDYDSSRSRRERSRSRDRRRKDDGYDDDARDRERRRDHRPREKHRDDDRYDSSSSRRSEHRVRERDRDRDHDRHRDRDHDRHRDRDRDRDRDDGR